MISADELLFVVAVILTVGSVVKDLHGRRSSGKNRKG
jgi:hypothetical protein